MRWNSILRLVTLLPVIGSCMSLMEGHCRAPAVLLLQQEVRDPEADKSLQSAQHAPRLLTRTELLHFYPWRDLLNVSGAIAMLLTTIKKGATEWPWTDWGSVAKGPEEAHFR